MATVATTGKGLLAGNNEDMVNATLNKWIKNTYKKEEVLPFEITAEAAAAKLEGFKYPVKTDESVKKTYSVIVGYDEDLSIILKFKNTKEGTVVKIHNEYGFSSINEQLDALNAQAGEELKAVGKAAAETGKAAGKLAMGLGKSLIKGNADDAAEGLKSAASGLGKSAMAAGKEAAKQKKEMIVAAKQAYEQAKASGNVKDEAVAVARISVLGGYTLIPVVGIIVSIIKTSKAKKAWRAAEGAKLPAIVDEILAELKK